jgi:hypothetical protein
VVADYYLQVRNQNCRYRVDEKRGQVQLRHRLSVCLCRKKDNRSGNDTSWRISALDMSQAGPFHTS